MSLQGDKGIIDTPGSPVSVEGMKSTIKIHGSKVESSDTDLKNI